LAKQGLPSEQGKIPVRKARAWIAANLDSARKDHWGGTGGAAPKSLNDFRRERERQKVQAGELDLAKARGELVARAEVRKFLADRARMERDSWLAWASAASARLSAATGHPVDRLFAALEREVRDHLQSLSERTLES